MQVQPKIPGYELLRPLGGGLLTSVFSARDCGTDKICAVKVLREDWEDQPTAVKLLQREARAGLAVRHPHLVRLLEAHVTHPPYFLVMELVSGESLRQRLRHDYRLQVPTALWIARQTAEALTALHKAGFVHGDVKPDNIRLVNDGTAVLMDLGFAHRPGENEAFLQQGYVLGTADYLAPEACGRDPSPAANWGRGSAGETDAASDLFSFGVTLFEMLSGERPYPPESLEQTLRRRRCEEPADIRAYGLSLPEPLFALIERLLARRSADRPRAPGVVQQLVALEIAAMRRRQSA